MNCQPQCSIGLSRLRPVACQKQGWKSTSYLSKPPLECPRGPALSLSLSRYGPLVPLSLRYVSSAVQREERDLLLLLLLQHCRRRGGKRE